MLIIHSEKGEREKGRERKEERESFRKRPLVERENFRLSGKVGSCRGENFGLNGMIFFSFSPLFPTKMLGKLLIRTEKKKTQNNTNFF